MAPNSDSDYNPSKHETRGRPRGSRNKRKRDLNDTPPRPRARLPRKPDATDSERSNLVDTVRQSLHTKFTEKQLDSANFGCFSPIPKATQVEAANRCYERNIDIMKELEETNTRCMYCYWCQMMCRKEDFPDNIWPWQEYYENLTQEAQNQIHVLIECNQCFTTEYPESSPPPSVPTCKMCHVAMSSRQVDGERRAKLARRASFLQPHLRCMHRYPKELMDLTPLEERAISINAPFGFITKLRMDLQWVGVKYRKHVKGHICVFPNNIHDLTTNVLPRTLQSTMENFLITWSGHKEPTDKDLHAYSTIRPLAIEKALLWLKANNPIYSNIVIDTEELSRWTETRVTAAIRACTQHAEPTADEKMNTAHYTTAEDRGATDEIGDVSPQELGIGILRNTGSQEELDPTNATTEIIVDERDTIYERDSSGVFDTEGSLRSTDIDRLQFAANALGAAIGSSISTNGQPTEENATRDSPGARIELRTTQTSVPYIHVRRGREFADTNDTQFWPKTFPTLFPHGVGGARIRNLPESRTQNEDNSKEDRHSTDGFSLRYWSNICLLRHGGRFARHAIFEFMIFNILVKSNNRRVSMQRMTNTSFRHFKSRWQSLTPERLKNAAKEMENTKETKDKDVQELMRQLSSFGYSFPLSAEARLQMRKRMQSSLIHFGLPIIWFTINPNDLTSPIKKWLSVCQSALPEEIEDLFQNLEDNYRRIRFGIEDPVSSVLFFHEEISVFFQHFIPVGTESSLGKVSHYVGAVETNERGMLHLHGMIWLNGNLQLPQISEMFSQDGLDPESESLREILKRRMEGWADTVLCQVLDEEDAVRAATEEPNIHTPLDDLTSDDPIIAWEGLVRDSNRIAYASQLHRHTATCYKYKTTYCRFGCPWTKEDKTNVGNDCILRLERNHERVVTYNRALASAFRHNHDMAFMYTKARSLSSMYYMTNYSTKFDLPMWKRLAYAAQVLQFQETEQEQRGNETTQADYGYADKARQFLMRTANRINTEQELSSVEVASYLLGFDSFISPIPTTGSWWPTVSMHDLYTSILRCWPHARELALAQNPLLNLDEGITITQSGVKINHLLAYPHRGPVYETLCLYDYMTLVTFQRVTKNTQFSSASLVPFPQESGLSSQWIQETRTARLAIPCLSGYINSRFKSEDPNFPAQAEIQHLGLFVPWYKFRHDNTNDLDRIWSQQKENLEDRLLFHVESCSLLRRSAEDARVDAEAWADKCAQADYVTDDYQDPDNMDEVIGIPASEAEQLEILHDVLRTETEHETGLAFLQSLRDELGETLSTDDQRYRWDTNTDPSNCGLTQADTNAFLKTQHIANHNILESRFGSGSADLEMQLDGIPDADIRYDTTSDLTHHIQPSMEVRYSDTVSWTAAANDIKLAQNLNNRQSLVMEKIAQHLQAIESQDIQDTEKNQLLLYVGGSGGVGKSWLIQAIEKLFQVMDDHHSLCITASTGSAAANINGRTVHSAIGLSLKGFCSQETENLLMNKWKKTKMLILDELSMISGHLFSKISKRLNHLRGHHDAEDALFGRTPIVMVLGDFAQFPPVNATSVIFPAKEKTPAASSVDDGNDEPIDVAPRDITAATGQLAGFKLFDKFKDVVILNEQMRTADPDLREMLQELRNGNPSKKYQQKLNDEVITAERQINWEETRAITPTNATRWRLNMDAVIGFARARNQLVRIFISHHIWTNANQSQKAATIRYGDNSWTDIPGMFFYTDGMPVLTNKNQYPGLKLMNGTEFVAKGIIPEDQHNAGLQIGTDTIIHFGPPAAILLESKETQDIDIPGLPRGQILLAADKIRMKPTRSKFKFLTGECIRRGLACTPAFALTDYKSQGRTFEKVIVDLRARLGGTHNIDPVTAYVSLSRCKTLSGIQMLKPVNLSNWTALGIPRSLRDALDMLERRSVLTLRRWS